MKAIYKPLLVLLMACMVLPSCSNKSNPTPAVSDLAALSGTWTTSAFGGVEGNVLKFTVSTDTKTGTVTQIGSSPFGFSVGDQLFTDIKATSTGYTAIGKYTYGPGSASSGTRAVVITLQNSGNQLTATYPAINASFPQIVYVYQKNIM